MAERTLTEVARLDHCPRRQQRYLQAMVADANSLERLTANNLLALSFWQHQDFDQAIATFKKTITMNPYCVEGVWAMRLLSLLYRQMGRKAEWFHIDMQRITSLKRILMSSHEDGELQFAVDELRREWADRAL
jgi:hypothetical protein